MFTHILYLLLFPRGPFQHFDENKFKTWPSYSVLTWHDVTSALRSRFSHYVDDVMWYLWVTALILSTGNFCTNCKACNHSTPTTWPDCRYCIAPACHEKQHWMRLWGLITAGQNARYISKAQGQFPYECVTDSTT